MVNRRVRRGEPKKKSPKKSPPREVVQIVIGDRTFVPAGDKRSFEQDIHMMDMLEQMGFNDVNPKDFAGTFSAQAQVFKIISKAYRAGRLFEMLGTAMVEVGKEEDWTPEVATEVGD